MAKFCKACGNALEETDTICKTCGKEVTKDQPANNQQPVQQPQVTVINNSQPVKRTNGMAVAGFVISLVSLLCCGATSLLGLIFSIIGLATAKNYDGNGKGLAIAGIIISCIFVIVAIVMTLLGTFASIIEGTAISSTISSY